MRVTLALAALLLSVSARAVVVEGPIEGPELPALPATVVPQTSANGLANPLFSPITGASIDAAVPTSIPVAALPTSGVQAQATAAGNFNSPRGESRSGSAEAQTARASAQRAADGITAKAGPEAAFARVFDGNFKKGSIEADLVAPMPGRDGLVDLSKLDTSYHGELTKKQAKRKLDNDREKLDVLQQKIFANKKDKILIILQGMDTGGKDGIIKHVLKGINPQGFKITGFKKPTKEEAAEGKWPRIMRALGNPGLFTVFNRSHYEDALVPLAKKTQSIEDVDKTIAEINAQEKAWADDGWTIIKIFLHVSNDTNWERLEERRTTKRKWWKLSKDDIVSRQNWSANQLAYEYVIPRTNTPYAPWFIIPADKKWYRNYAAGRIIRRAAKRLHPKWPRPKDLPKRIPK